MAFGNVPENRIGIYQTIGGVSNDIASLAAGGGNVGAVKGLLTSTSTAEKVVNGASIGANYYTFYSGATTYNNTYTEDEKTTEEKDGQ